MATRRSFGRRVRAREEAHGGDLFTASSSQPPLPDPVGTTVNGARQGLPLRQNSRGGARPATGQLQAAREGYPGLRWTRFRCQNLRLVELFKTQ